jgi:hypothetical protein
MPTALTKPQTSAVTCVGKQLNLHINNRTQEQRYLLPLADNVIGILDYAASNGSAISGHARK